MHRRYDAFVPVSVNIVDEKGFSVVDFFGLGVAGEGQGERFSLVFW